MSPLGIYPEPGTFFHFVFQGKAFSLFELDILSFGYWNSALCFNASSTHHLSLNYLVFFCTTLIFMQFHIRVLESAPDTVSLLLTGLEYLINISYVDDTEVFKVCKLLLIQLYILFSP